MRPPRSFSVVTATATVAVLVLAALPMGDAAAASRAKHKTKTTKVSLAAGVTLRHQTYTKSGHAQSVYWVTTRMSAHVGLTAVTPKHAMGAAPMTTLAMANQEHAIAGLNGDTFYFDTSPKGKAYNPTLGPRGGVMTNGVTLKAPLAKQDAVLSVTSSGRAYIGDVGFSGSLRATTDGKQTGGPKQIATVNSVETAWNGSITFIDPNLVGHSLRGTCSEAVLAPTSTPNHYLVTALREHISSFARLTGTSRGLLACAGGSRNNPAWFNANLHPGKTYVNTAIGYRSKGLQTLISGTNLLVRKGKVYHDTAAHRALNEYGNKRMPDSWACVSKDRRSVSLGVFEGHKAKATGVTYAEAAAWLVSSQHCWEAMALDGSTSSQLVARRPHASLKLLNRATAAYKGGQRPQTDGIFVVAK